MNANVNQVYKIFSAVSLLTSWLAWNHFRRGPSINQGQYRLIFWWYIRTGKSVYLIHWSVILSLFLWLILHIFTASLSYCHSEFLSITLTLWSLINSTFPFLIISHALKTFLSFSHSLIHSLFLSFFISHSLILSLFSFTHTPFLSYFSFTH